MKNDFSKLIYSFLALSFTLLLTSSCEQKLTDIDGNIYKTVKIGDQVWMAENLRVTRYNNGDPIETTNPANIDISDLVEPKFQWVFGGKEELAATYGRLYTWYAATDARKICPEGWHVITDAEWAKLYNYFGGKSVAGGKLKEAGTEDWAHPNTDASNSSGFTARPGGGRGSNGAFGGVNYYGAWWGTVEKDSLVAGYWHLYYNTSALKRTDFHKNSGFSVRCVRDL